MDEGGDFFEFRQELIVVEGDLAVVGLPLPLRVDVGPLVGDDPRPGLRDDAGAGQFPRGDIAVPAIVVGDSAGGVLDPVFGPVGTDVARGKEVREEGPAGFGHGDSSFFLKK
ncbi:MAG: hypothetical protein AB1556_15445 [Bacillota bacterium]